MNYCVMVYDISMSHAIIPKTGSRFVFNHIVEMTVEYINNYDINKNNFALFK